MPVPVGPPTCDVSGYDCTCEELPAVKPETRRPTPCNDEYVDYKKDMEAWTAYKKSLGWNNEAGWDVKPNSYVGFHIFLDEWSAFGG